MQRSGNSKMTKKKWYAITDCTGKGHKMGRALSSYVQTTIWSSQQPSFPQRHPQAQIGIASS